NTQPRWTTDGRHLLFLSNRTGTTELWRADLRKPGAAAASESRVAIDAERIDRRAHQLTNQSQADKRSYLLAADGKDCFFPISVLGKTELWSVPVEGGAPARMLPLAGGNVQLSADGTTLYYEAG